MPRPGKGLSLFTFLNPQPVRTTGLIFVHQIQPAPLLPTTEAEAKKLDAAEPIEAAGTAPASAAEKAPAESGTQADVVSDSEVLWRCCAVLLKCVALTSSHGP